MIKFINTALLNNEGIPIVLLILAIETAILTLIIVTIIEYLKMK